MFKAKKCLCRVSQVRRPGNSANKTILRTPHVSGSAKCKAKRFTVLNY